MINAVWHVLGDNALARIYCVAGNLTDDAVLGFSYLGALA